MSSASHVGAESIEALRAKLALQDEVIFNLSATIKLQAESIKKLSEKMSKEEESGGQLSKEGFLSALEEHEEREKKITNLVVLKSPEDRDEAKTNEADMKLAHKLCKVAEVPFEDVARVFRHGPRKPNHARPIKICFKRKDIPSTVLSTLRSERLFAEVLPRGSRIRRDLTTSEQEVEYLARKQCFELNQKEQMNAYFVDDSLRIAKKRTPTVWRGPLLDDSTATDNASSDVRLASQANVTTRRSTRQ